MKPYIRTKRLNIYRVKTAADDVHVEKWVFIAMPNGEVLGDVSPRVYVTVTLDPRRIYGGDYNIEWVETIQQERRNGYATEALAAIAGKVGAIEGEGVTSSGRAFYKSFMNRVAATKR